MTMTTDVSTRPVFSIGDERGFTLVEFLVAIAIIGLILASVVPFIMAKREMSKRVACTNNLRMISYAMAEYRNGFNTYPRTRFDRDKGDWTCYSGADDANPFAPETTVQANDVTASLWLLARIGYLPDPSVFVCPSSDRIVDPMTNSAGQRVNASQRSNFRARRNLAYSMLSPFNAALGDRWDDTLPSECALLADMNPGVAGKRDDVSRPASGDGPDMQVFANSNNHAKAGQNVLYAGGNVTFVSNAFVGMGYIAPGSKDPRNDQPIPSRAGDNIYTSLRASPNTPDGKSPSDGMGAYGKSIPPSWQYDSYLLPSDDD